VEILLEIVVLAIVLLLLQTFVEWFLQGSGEFIADAIGFGANHPPPPLWVATISYFSFGALLGAISLLALPALFISSLWRRVLNIVVSPIVIAFLVTLFAAWFKRAPTVQFIKTFYFAYCFALATVVARFAWGVSGAQLGN
jgi:hypothetical protein